MDTYPNNFFYLFIIMFRYRNLYVRVKEHVSLSVMFFNISFDIVMQ